MFWEALQDAISSATSFVRALAKGRSSLLILSNQLTEKKATGHK